MYANKIGYSDVTPFEVVKACTVKKLIIREMETIIDETWKPDFHPGGFVGHVANNRDQKWIIKPLISGATVEIRQHKNGEWKDKYGNRYNLSNKPVKFYDYNF